MLPVISYSHFKFTLSVTQPKQISYPRAQHITRSPSPASRPNSDLCSSLSPHLTPNQVNALPKPSTWEKLLGRKAVVMVISTPKPSLAVIMISSIPTLVLISEMSRC